MVRAESRRDAFLRALVERDSTAARRAIDAAWTAAHEFGADLVIHHAREAVARLRDRVPPQTA
jgi:hypothetical protein